MSILIKGMDMPKNCDECPLLTKDGDYDVCFVGKRLVMWDWKHDRGSEVIHPKPDWCPLIEVPEHGDLIDRDALLARFYVAQEAIRLHGQEFSNCFKSNGELCTEWWCVEDAVENAPTVIPADKDGET